MGKENIGQVQRMLKTLLCLASLDHTMCGGYKTPQTQVQPHTGSGLDLQGEGFSSSQRPARESVLQFPQLIPLLGSWFQRGQFSLALSQRGQFSLALSQREQPVHRPLGRNEAGALEEQDAGQNGFLP